MNCLKFYYIISIRQNKTLSTDHCLDCGGVAWQWQYQFSSSRARIFIHWTKYRKHQKAWWCNFETKIWESKPILLCELLFYFPYSNTDQKLKTISHHVVKETWTWAIVIPRPWMNDFSSTITSIKAVCVRDVYSSVGFGNLTVGLCGSRWQGYDYGHYKTQCCFLLVVIYLKTFKEKTI